MLHFGAVVRAQESGQKGLDTWRTAKVSLHSHTHSLRHVMHAISTVLAAVPCGLLVLRTFVPSLVVDVGTLMPQ